MIQVSKNVWIIEAPNGNVLQKDITVSSVVLATEYVKNYISSYQAWNYVVIPMDSKPKI